MKTEGFLYLRRCAWQDQPELYFSTSGLLRSDEYAAVRLICPHTLEADVPNTDMRAEMVSGLREQERDLRAQFEKSITDIQRRINELLAIEA